MKLYEFGPTRSIRARWMLFAVTELEQPLWRIARHTALYPEKDRLSADVVLAARDFAPMAAVAEDHMKGRTYVVGDNVTAADFVLAFTLDWAGEAQQLGDFPTRAPTSSGCMRGRALRGASRNTSGRSGPATPARRQAAEARACRNYE